MTELHASRTIVKSPPELWAECSDAASLARHLGRFGEIRITRLDPETTVAWEGERARGTVRIEPAGWGTKVSLTAVAVDAGPPEPADPPAPVGVSEEPPEPVKSPSGPEPESVQLPSGPEPQPVGLPSGPEPKSVQSPRAEAEPMPARSAPAAGESLPRRGRFARLMAWLRGPELVPEPKTPEAAPVPEADDRLTAPEPAQAPPPPASAEQPPPAPQSSPDADAEAALTAALDSLGQAHHRPYSRA